MVSGNGSNLQALMDAIENQHLHATISLVVSNRAKAFGLERAKNAGIPTLLLNLKSFQASTGGTREQYDRQLGQSILSHCQPHPPDLIVLAGWMHILSASFLNQFQSIINLHPALPGAFNGANAIARAFQAYQEGKIQSTGIMVHYVTPEVDVGEVILTRDIPIIATDTLETLETRMHQVEHEILVDAVKIVLQSKK
jgi:formyltetrahydrofolate-dependent phosphoribosylglycinamide formyltransferase